MTPTETTQPAAAPGHGICTACQGSGINAYEEPCAACGQSGACPSCQGHGISADRQPCADCAQSGATHTDQLAAAALAAHTTTPTAHVTAWCIYDYAEMDSPLFWACLSFMSAEDSQHQAFTEMRDYMAGQYESINDEAPNMDELRRAWADYSDEEPDGSIAYDVAALAHELECSYCHANTAAQPLPEDAHCRSWPAYY
jgi:hypothetical protein